MCLTIPGRVVRIEAHGAEPRMGRVDFGIAERTANLLFTPEVEVGDFVIVQAGFAIRRVSEAEATEALAYLNELGRTPPGASAGATGG